MAARTRGRARSKDRGEEDALAPLLHEIVQRPGLMSFFYRGCGLLFFWHLDLSDSALNSLFHKPCTESLETRGASNMGTGHSWSPNARRYGGGLWRTGLTGASALPIDPEFRNLA